MNGDVILKQLHKHKYPESTEQFCCERANDCLKQHCEETGHDALNPQVLQEATDRMVTHYDL